MTTPADNVSYSARDWFRAGMLFGMEFYSLSTLGLSPHDVRLVMQSDAYNEKLQEAAASVCGYDSWAALSAAADASPDGRAPRLGQALPTGGRS